MNDTTLSLAQVLGPMLAFVGLGIFLNPKYYEEALKDLTKGNFAIMATWMAMIAVGVIIVRQHFLWGSLAEVLVSLIGLGFLVKGVFWALLPKAFSKFTNAILSTTLVRFGTLLWAIGGGYLIWVGFFA